MPISETEWNAGQSRDSVETRIVHLLRAVYPKAVNAAEVDGMLTAEAGGMSLADAMQRLAAATSAEQVAALGSEGGARLLSALDNLRERGAVNSKAIMDPEGRQVPYYRLSDATASGEWGATARRGNAELPVIYELQLLGWTVRRNVEGWCTLEAERGPLRWFIVARASIGATVPWPAREEMALLLTGAHRSGGRPIIAEVFVLRSTNRIFYRSALTAGELSPQDGSDRPPSGGRVRAASPAGGPAIPPPTVATAPRGVPTAYAPQRPVPPGSQPPGPPRPGGPAPGPQRRPHR